MTSLCDTCGARWDIRHFQTPTRLRSTFLLTPSGALWDVRSTCKPGCRFGCTSSSTRGAVARSGAPPMTSPDLRGSGCLVRCGRTSSLSTMTPRQHLRMSPWQRMRCAVFFTLTWCAGVRKSHDLKGVLYVPCEYSICILFVLRVRSPVNFLI